MAERLAQVGADFEMHYCTRSRARTAFVDRIERSSFSDRIHYHFDTGPEDQKLRADVLLVFRIRSHVNADVAVPCE